MGWIAGPRREFSNKEFGIALAVAMLVALAASIALGAAGVPFWIGMPAVAVVLTALFIGLLARGRRSS